MQSNRVINTGGSINTAAHKIRNKMKSIIISLLAAQLYNVRNYVITDDKAAAIERKIKECKLATQVTRRDNIDYIKDDALIILSGTFEDIRINVMYAGGMLYITLVRNVMYGDVVRIVLHPDGSAEYTLDQLPF